MTAKLIDVSGWSEVLAQTEGTRDKRKLLSPLDGTSYYFKSSLKRYPMEFWSEVIASRIGKSMGFDLLEYNVAYIHTNEEHLVGCLSRSLFEEEKEVMLFGYSVLAEYDKGFAENTKTQGYHSLDLINESLKAGHLEHIFVKVLECYVFDYIVGNSDRHSENWAIICPHIQAGFDKSLSLVGGGTKNDGALELIKALQVELRKTYRLSQIYDSGSSLGRELTEERIEKMLKDERMLESYMNRLRLNITVDSRAVKAVEDFDLLLKRYGLALAYVFDRVRLLGEEEHIREVVYHIDRDILHELPPEYRLSNQRKEFVTRLVSYRIDRIIKSITDYGL